MADLVFPRKLLREADHDWNVAGSNAVAGSGSATPSVDVNSDGGGFWIASINNIQFWDRTFTLLWRAVRQACNGGRNPLVVPRNDLAFAPFPAGGPVSDNLTFDDSTLFDDGTGLYQPSIDIETTAAASLRGTSLSVALLLSAPLQGGEAFSIKHPTWDWRIYEIATVTMIDAINAIIVFNPPLREDVPLGTVLDFDRPRCTMKLMNPAAMDLNVTTWPFSCPSVKFIESKFAT